MEPEGQPSPAADKEENTDNQYNNDGQQQQQQQDAPTEAKGTEDDVYPFPQPSKLTLSDVQNAFPAESSEERIVMEHIERTDPTPSAEEQEEEDGTETNIGSDGDDRLLFKAPASNGGRSESFLLTHSVTSIPPELVVTMQEEKMQNMFLEEQMRSNDRRRLSRSDERKAFYKKKDAPKTVEDELFELTNMLRPRQSGELSKEANSNGEDGTAEDEEKDDEDSEAEERKPLTQTEAFAANAAEMFKNLTTKVTQRPSFFPGMARMSSKADHQQQGGEESNGKLVSRISDSRHKGLHNSWDTTLQNMKEVERIIKRGRKSIYTYIRNVTVWIIWPCLLVAFLLYYAMGNPGAVIIFVTDPDGNSTETITSEVRTVSNEQPSFSWLFLFFGVRQVITFGMAVGLQHLVVTYYQQAGLSFVLVGPMARLLIIQAKGWPLIATFWGFADLMLLFGNTRFANHWMFYQSFIGIFSEVNPSGGFPAFHIYQHVVIFTLGAGIAVALKRFLIGLRFGQNSYYRYADRLSSVLKNVLQVSRISRLPEITRDYIARQRQTFVDEAIECNIWLEKHAYMDCTEKHNHGEEMQGSVDGKQSLNLGMLNESILSSAQQLKIDEMLGEWEEIELTDKTAKDPSLNAIVQFGSSVGVLESSFPFGQAFGKAETRHQVVDCAQNVYSDLLELQQNLQLQSVYANAGGQDPATTLKFHTLAITTIDDIGDLDMKMTKDLMAVFRPTREGDISLVEFVKSVDTVYKEIRKLRANIANEGKMNAGTEKMINAMFYFALIFCFLAAIGVDPIVVFGGLSTFFISFSFCVGGASSDYIRGLLFILAQRPYDIGDVISIANPDDPADGNGSPQWTVKDVSLYHTTVVYNFSNEIGTISNGAIASKRVLNGSRSPRANLHFFLKFGIRVKLEAIAIFKERLYEYIKSKPREWLRPVAFRLSLIAADLGYSQYFILLTHREPWNQIAALKNSLSDVHQFCFRLVDELDMGYESPPLPVLMQTSRTAVAGTFSNAMNINNHSKSDNAGETAANHTVLSPVMDLTSTVTRSTDTQQNPFFTLSAKARNVYDGSVDAGGDS